MILGISASGRKDGVTAKTVQAILEASGSDYEYISLAGRKIDGCMGCTLCAADNICKLRDDWNEISEKMLMADAIVFGAPNYGGIINALGHACLERTFCFRHRGAFRLKGKLGVIVTTQNALGGPDMVNTLIKGAMAANIMHIVGEMTARGVSQCYTCGFGNNCPVGNVVKDHGVLENIEPRHFPPAFEDQADTVAEASALGILLGSELKKRLAGAV